MCFVIVFPHPHSPFYVSFSLSVPFLWNRVFPITFPWVRTEVFVTCCPDWPELESELCNTSWHWHGEGSKPSSHQIALSTQEQTYHTLIFFLSPTSAFLLTLVKSPPMHKPVQVQRNIEVHLLISKMILNCSFAVKGPLIFCGSRLCLTQVKSASEKKSASWIWNLSLHCDNQQHCQFSRWFVVEICTLMLTWHG